MTNLYSAELLYKIKGMLGDKKKAHKIIFDKDVKAEIDKIAREQERSTSWLINDILKKYVEKRRKK